MMQATEHVYPTLGTYVSDLHAPIINGRPLERIIRCRDCDHFNDKRSTCNLNAEYGTVVYPSGEMVDVVDGVVYVEPEGFCWRAAPKEAVE